MTGLTLSEKTLKRLRHMSKIYGISQEILAEVIIASVYFVEYDRLRYALRELRYRNSTGKFLFDDDGKNLFMEFFECYF